MMQVLRWIATAVVALMIVAIIGGVIVFLAVPDLFKGQREEKSMRLNADQRGLATGIESYRVGQPVLPPPEPSIEQPRPADTAEPNPLIR